ncbi:hypothetical protein WR25_00332 [Diploscapter pachys]|uniref:CUB domain-containing protein n=1 Tax=Diploscapter pachys TaxID=2018661 RepID=A0A2A2L6P8_9BILA|nr:hypothetical protein WR25_00332 [Diploscapter pachys]
MIERATCQRSQLIVLLLVLFLPLTDQISPNDDICVSFKGIGGSNSITTPNFPEKYSPKVDCVRVIRAIEGHDVTLKFKDLFEIETSYDPNLDGRTVVSDCPNDFVEVRDGRYGFSPLLGRFCGKAIPTQELRATSGFMWVRFYSDEILQYKGFHAVYNMTSTDVKRVNMAEYLRKELTSLDGYINSEDILPFILFLNFSGPLDFVWRLSVPQDFRIAFYFQEFALYKPNDCEENFFEVYSGSTSHTPVKRQV